MNALSTRLLVSTVLTLALALVCAASAYSAGDPPAIATGCVRDLAKRLSVPTQDVKIAEFKGMDWPDASLGLPRPDKMYAQVVTPGWRILLEAKNRRYLYCTSDRSFSYGGPLGAWSASALYVTAPAEPDGNLNKDLYQISLAGTNPTLLIPRVGSFYPQADGSIIASRRTSRSGFDLLYLAPGQADAARTIDGAFDFGEAVVSADGKQWYGFIRGGLLEGPKWTLQVKSLESADVKPVVYDLPDLARPGRLVVTDGRFYAHLFIGDKDGWYRLDPRNAAAGWERLDQYWPPDPFSLSLNKSQCLSADVTRNGDKPVTEIFKLWFTGKKDPVATIDNFETKGMALVAGRFGLTWGQQGGDLKAYTVDISTGEAMPSVPGPVELVRPFATPPHGSPLK